MSERARVFVYGSLRRGLPAHGHLAHASLRSETTTAEPFRLLDLGPFPGAVPGGATPIRGEVYEVDPDTLAWMDDFEDVPETYQRIRVRLADGEEAWMYRLQPEAAATMARGEVPHGCWRTWWLERSDG